MSLSGSEVSLNGSRVILHEYRVSLYDSRVILLAQGESTKLLLTLTSTAQVQLDLGYFECL